MFNGIDLTNRALDASMMRYNDLSDNIANVDTVGYKRKDVKFEEALIRELDKNGINGIELERVNPEKYTDKSNYSYRLDGNNVDIDKETSELAKAKLRYDTLISRANSQIGRYKYILQNIK